MILFIYLELVNNLRMRKEEVINEVKNPLILTTVSSLSPAILDDSRELDE